tara:strand:+ start:6339 stop:6488 length:150 start_codon:yes stop_codon:yes gene_type:complete
MEITTATLIALKKAIEKHTEQDPNITDVIINVQLKETDNKNFLKFNIKN